MIPKHEQDALVASHIRAAEKFAWRTARIAGLVERIDDIRGEAFVGLVEAAKRFDPNRGIRFLTFAAYWMRHHMNSYVDQNRHTVRPSNESGQRNVAMKLRDAESRLLQRLGRVATDTEVAEEIGCRVVLVEKARARFRKHDIVISDTERQADHFTPVCSSATPEDVAAHESTQREYMRAINRAMHRLEPREREVIRRRHLAHQPETLADISRSWGTSREWVRQVEARALKRMRSALQGERVRLMEVA